MVGKEIVAVTVTYRSSVEKWKGIREFVDVNDLGGINEIDAMIAHIKYKGDEVLPDEYTFEMKEVGDHLDAMYSEVLTPCPHCIMYVDCKRCPLSDKRPVIGGFCTCCPEWSIAVLAAQEAIQKNFLDR